MRTVKLNKVAFNRIGINHSIIAMRVSTLFLFIVFILQTARGQNVSVDPISGRAIVSIPIYNLNYGGVSIPINLEHSESAIMVEETEGDAGLGWNLTCNYGVYRQVRGLPDDLSYIQGWLYASSTTAAINSFSPQSPDDLSTYTTGESSDFTFINNLGYNVDTEPDLYTVAGPGLYFQFVFDATGVPRLLNYEDVKITPLSSSGGFTVQNNKGITFQFTYPEMVTRQSFQYKGHTVDAFTTEYNYYSPSQIQFARTWHLTQAADPNGNTVTFNYGSVATQTENNYRVRIDGTNTLDTLYRTSDSFAPVVLSSITGGNYAVNFSWASNRLLSTIKISESGLNDTFQYGFSYLQVVSTTNPAYPRYFHSFLSQIIPVAGNCVPQPPYSFAYQNATASPVEMPWSTLYSQDMWGYYSGSLGAASIQSVPQLYYSSSPTDSRRFSFFQIPNTTPLTLPGANRNVQASKVGIGSLIQVNYPSGGFTKIVWERNKYLDSLSNQVLFGPGQRVASLITDGGEAAFGKTSADSNPYHQITKNYTYTKSDADTTTSGLAMYPPEYGIATGTRILRTPYDLSPGSYVSYRRVKETTIQGSTVYTYSVPGTYPATTYFTDWTATKSKIARNPSTQKTINSVQNGYYTFPFAPNPNYSFGQGLLTSVSEYSTTNSTVAVRQKQYYYSRINPALQSVYGLKFENFGSLDCDCFHFSKYQIITGTTNVLIKQVSTEASESNTNQLDKVITYYHYNSDVVNNNFLMDSVRTVWGDGSVSRKKIKYVKDFASIVSPTPGDVMANAIAGLVTANRHGEVVEQYTSFKPIGGMETITGGNLQLFQNLGSGKIYPYQSFSFPEGQSLTPSAVATGTTQGFSYSGKYILSSSINDYDAVGNPISISDNKQNKVAYHNAINYSLAPVASIANATARQTVYEGFEFVTARNLTPNASLSYATGRTGQQAAILTQGSTLTSSVDNAGVPYRISCWINAAQASTVTFQFTNLTNVVKTFSYTTPGQWTYFDDILNVSSQTPSSLNLQITSSATTSATVTIDDIVVVPQNATVSTQTFLPLKGATSKTDDRGNSTTVTYDAMGRKVNTFDRQRNLVEFDEYQMKGTTASFLSSFFTYGNAVAGTPFTATLSANGGNCFAATYQWQVDQVNVNGATTSSLTTTVATPGVHVVSLTVTNTITQQVSVTSQNVTFLLNSSPPTFSFTSLPPNNTRCNTDGAFQYVISSPVLGCGGAQSSTYTMWYTSSDNGVTYQIAQGVPGTTTTNTSITTAGPSGQTLGFYLKATVFQTCYVNNAMEPSSTTSSTFIVEPITVNNCKGN